MQFIVSTLAILIMIIAGIGCYHAVENYPEMNSSDYTLVLFTLVMITSIIKHFMDLNGKDNSKE